MGHVWNMFNLLWSEYALWLCMESYMYVWNNMKSTLSLLYNTQYKFLFCVSGPNSATVHQMLHCFPHRSFMIYVQLLKNSILCCNPTLSQTVSPDQMPFFIQMITIAKPLFGYILTFLSRYWQLLGWVQNWKDGLTWRKVKLCLTMWPCQTACQVHSDRPSLCPHASCRGRPWLR